MVGKEGWMWKAQPGLCSTLHVLVGGASDTDGQCEEWNVERYERTEFLRSQGKYTLVNSKINVSNSDVDVDAYLKLESRISFLVCCLPTFKPPCLAFLPN